MSVTNPTKAEAFGRQHFLAGQYTLDLSGVAAQPVKINGEAATFLDAYRKLRASRIEYPPEGIFNEATYRTDDGEIKLESDWTLISTMGILMYLSHQGIDPFRVAWFYYDHDSSTDADESYTFFVVHENRFVMEACTFTSHEPMILKSGSIDSIWKSHRHFTQAVDLYWYRRFYTQAVAGQIMVLRPDNPILYHYERAQGRNLARETEVATLVKTGVVTLAKMYVLLAIAIPLLVALAFPSTSPFMAATAVLLAIWAIWRVWAIHNWRGDR